jgi:MFS superfamily sulfate permease-like transporter
VGVAAAGVQILFGLFKAGVLGDFFPASAVHGVLAAIGIIIISKQVPTALGVTPHGKEPLELLAEIPDEVIHMNPEIALIGGIGLLILFLYPLTKNPIARKVPAALIVLAVAIPLGIYFNLNTDHHYSLLGHDYVVGKSFLVDVPSKITSAITFPDFSVFTNSKYQLAAVKWVAMFALIGSLESMLSAKAIDLLDPKKRKTNLNRDLLAVGVANLASAAIGGLPMISEIVRSRANIDNGAKSKWANAFHGLFLFVAVLLCASLIRMIPRAALAAMLVYTGFRLAHPREFLHVYKIGREQLVVFVGTIVAVLATDLLVGILIGVGIELLIHFINGVPLKSILFANSEVRQLDEKTWLICPTDAAVFSNWLAIRSRIERFGMAQEMNVTVDLSNTKIVDHTVMHKLTELRREFSQRGLELNIVGLDSHMAISRHPSAARLRGEPGRAHEPAAEFAAH